MSKLTGGIFSNPSGTTAGLVFGAARTRQGKVVTARQLVPPSNPNTAGQQTQRNKFKDCLDITRFNGPDIYQSDFNRAISQLPGFQSMMSIYMNAMDSSRVLSDPPTINLGNLHLPDTINFTSPGGGELSVTFSGELGDNGTNNDEVVVFCIDTTSAGRDTLMGINAVGEESRSSGNQDFSELTNGNSYLVGFYLRGAGDAEGLLSQCVWDIVTVS